MTDSPAGSPAVDGRVAGELDALHHADQRLVRTVDSLDEDAWRGPSLLPGWSRAHVVAHLALNAEAFAGALEAIDRGEVVPIYPSQESRDRGIEELAERAPGELRERLFAATTRLRDAITGLTGSQWDETVLRLPEGPAWPSTALPGARRREVEIHHADLDAGYRPDDWPTDFAVALLDQATLDQAASGGDRFAVRADDLGRTWTVGAEQPVVEGSAAHLGWWLTGRGTGEGLRCASGLPRLGDWRRAPDVEPVETEPHRTPVVEPVETEPHRPA